MVLAMNGDTCWRRLENRLGVDGLLLLFVRLTLRPASSGPGHAPWPSAEPPPGLRSRWMSEVWVDGGGARLSSPEPEDSVEIRLTGRRSEEEESEGVADGARSLLLMEAVDRREESEERGGVIDR